ncbi:MAG: rod shape-determining protein MreC [Acidobacteria bacterium]|nr:rod shape-determining protein MreC [Acidobacteriota bacterium]
MTTSHRNLVILAAVVLLQLLLLAYQLRRNESMPLIRYGTIMVVTPVQKTFHAVVQGIGGVWGGYVDLWHTRQENEDLLRDLNRLRLDNNQLRNQAEQARRLQVLFDFRQETPFRLVAAQVIGSDAAQTSRLLLIDKGSEAGLQPDLAVLVPEGVVGKVLHVFPNAAQVLLLTDGNSGLGGLLEESRIHGVVRGNNSPLGDLAYIPNGEKVEIGSRVVTSGEDKIFPKGLPVGVVVSAQPGIDFQQIQVQPVARLNRLEEVLVILPGSSPESPEDMAQSGSGSPVATLSPASQQQDQPNPAQGLAAAPAVAAENAEPPPLPATPLSPASP